MILFLWSLLSKTDEAGHWEVSVQLYSPCFNDKGIIAPANVYSKVALSANDYWLKCA
jgi:hypothetical protein